MRVAGLSSLERGLGGWNLPWRSDGTKVRVWPEAGGGVLLLVSEPRRRPFDLCSYHAACAVPAAMVSGRAPAGAAALAHPGCSSEPEAYLERLAAPAA